MNIRWEVYEEYNGGLYLSVVEDGRRVFIGRYEDRPGKLKKDIDALNYGLDPRKLKGNILEYDRYFYRNFADDIFTLVAFDDKICVTEMRDAARTEFLLWERVYFTCDGRRYIRDLSCLEEWMHENGVGDADTLYCVTIGGFSAGDMYAGDLLEIM